MCSRGKAAETIRTLFYTYFIHYLGYYRDQCFESAVHKPSKYAKFKPSHTSCQYFTVILGKSGKIITVWAPSRSPLWKRTTLLLPRHLRRFLRIPYVLGTSSTPLTFRQLDTWIYPLKTSARCPSDGSERDAMGRTPASHG